MKKLSFLGSGLMIGSIILPWLMLTIYFTLRFKPAFSIVQGKSSVLMIIGIILVAVGLIMYLITVPFLLKGLRETKLVTKGTFWLCRNPLYASIILFIFPGTALMMNSWLVFTTSIAGYVAFKKYIRKEYEEMEEFFGDEYKKYRESTPEFFPFPLKKMFNS